MNEPTHLLNKQAAKPPKKTQAELCEEEMFRQRQQRLRFNEWLDRIESDSSTNGMESAQRKRYLKTLND